jgi:DNA-binding transcriptional LysR family regulator
MDRIVDIEQLKKGRLTIGVPNYRGSILLPLVLPLFLQKYPGINIKIIEADSAELEVITAKGRTNLTIMNLPIQSNRITYTPITTEKILLAIPPNHHLKSRITDLPQKFSNLPTVQLSELKDEPFILLKSSHRLRQTSDALFEYAGIKPIIRLEINNLLTAHKLIASGMGVSFIGETAAKLSYFPQPPLYFSLDGPKTTWHLVAAYREDRYLSRAATEFIQMLKEALNGENK